MKKPRAEARGLFLIVAQRLIVMTVAVAIDVIAVVLVAVLMPGGRTAAIGAVVAVTDRVADQAAGDTTHGGADKAVRGKAADQRARTGAKSCICRGVPVAGRGGRNGDASTETALGASSGAL